MDDSEEGITPSAFLEEARKTTERIKQQQQRNLGPFGDDGGTGVGALFAGSGPASSGLPGWGDGYDDEEVSQLI